MSDAIDDFLTRAGCASAGRAAIAGDASGRRYERLSLGHGSAILMDARAEPAMQTRRFVAMALHLRALGLSAPEILFDDAEGGLLLLEDLGDRVFSREMAADPSCEIPLYDAALDALDVFQSAAPPPDLPRFGPEEMADAVTLIFEAYAPGPDAERTRLFRDEFRAKLAEIETDPPVLSLRDYHAENLIWLPERSAAARAGLLDFQDAVLTHPLYDLVSVITDARRDLSPGAIRHLQARWRAEHGPDDFDSAFATLSAQRNLRILAVFAHLARTKRKTGYLSMVPRVWRHLTDALAHPSLATLRGLCAELLPEPDREHLTYLARHA